MINLLKKRKTRWIIKSKMIFLMPYRVEEIVLRGKTRKKVYRLFKLFKKKMNKYGFVEFINCEEITLIE